jgi:hypothetical protein
MTLKGLAPAAAAALLVLPATALAAAPENDNYLQSSPLSPPGQPVPRDATVRVTGDTSEATTQPDLFNPQANGSPGSGGGPEPVTCETSSYGRTVWWDFFPDVSGVVKIVVNNLPGGAAWDPVIRVTPYDRNTAVPAFASGACIDRLPSTSEELQGTVRGGSAAAYTIQVGGVGDTGGPYEMLFDFFPDTDGDGFLDSADKCPSVPGTSEGCPARLRADSKLRARPTGDGIVVTGMTVSAPRGARVEAKFPGGRQVKKASALGAYARVRPPEILAGSSSRPVAHASRTVSFSRLRNRRLRAGSKIEVRVTQTGAIGTYFRYTVVRGNFKKITRCMNPGSRTPRRRCP